jgi:hypothetical protein
MILELLAIGLAVARPAAAADEAPPPTDAGAEARATKENNERADAFATPVDELAERMIGSASRPVRFDWRRSPVGVAFVASELLERNNFGATRLGLTARRAFGDAIGEIGANYCWSWPTDSSELLALTPYRQAGRPNRFELDLNVSYAVAEGVVTPLPDLLPAAEMVFLGTAGLRYLIYPEAYRDFTLQDAALASASPGLTQKEIDNLEDSRLPGMQVDGGRYGILAGISLDIYFQPGVYVTPRALVNIPVLAVTNGSRLGFWWETSIGVGYAF